MGAGARGNRGALAVVRTVVRTWAWGVLGSCRTGRSRTDCLTLPRPGAARAGGGGAWPRWLANRLASDLLAEPPLLESATKLVGRGRDAPGWLWRAATYLGVCPGPVVAWPC